MANTSDLESWIGGMPKAELHVHLEGVSLSALYHISHNFLFIMSE